ncbi:MAG TPA: hypothetical protein P5338_09190, partial [Bacteroidales bacterium]|nr:hypothetical protein [Bacteroidales bacterium]
MEKNGNEKPDPRSGNGNTTKNKRLFWIYGIIVFALLILTSIRWGGELKEITWLEFEREMLLKHHVEKVVVVNQKTVEVYIRKDSLKNPLHSEKYKVNKRGFNDADNPGPHYSLPVVTIEQFEKRFDALQEKLLAQDTTGLWQRMQRDSASFSEQLYRDSVEQVR